MINIFEAFDAFPNFKKFLNIFDAFQTFFLVFVTHMNIFKHLHHIWTFWTFVRHVNIFVSLWKKKIICTSYISNHMKHFLKLIILSNYSLIWPQNWDPSQMFNSIPKQNLREKEYKHN